MDEAEERAAWLGWPVWGLAVAAIFLSYNAVGAADVDLPYGLTGWLWVPWVGLGIAANRATASALGVESPGWRDRSVWVSRLAGIGAFLAVEGLVSLAPGLVGPNARNLAYTGGIAIALAVLQRVRGNTTAGPGVMAGVGLLGLAYFLPRLAGGHVAQGLVAAFGVAGGFTLVGGLGLARMDS